MRRFFTNSVSKHKHIQVPASTLMVEGARSRKHELVEIHGVRPLDAVVANVALLVRDVVQDERSHGCEKRRLFTSNDQDQWLMRDGLTRSRKFAVERDGVGWRGCKEKSWLSSHAMKIEPGTKFLES